jgi:hypothetical protein
MEFVEVKWKLPKPLVDWLNSIAKCRNESIEEVIAWTLGNLYNYYERWVVIPRKLECGELEKLEEMKRSEDFKEYLEKRLEDFKEHLRAKNIKKYDDYYYIVRKFVQWLLNRGVNDLSSISDETINEYLEKLNVKPSTKGTYKYCLKKFLEFLKHTPQE